MTSLQATPASMQPSLTPSFFPSLPSSSSILSTQLIASHPATYLPSAPIYKLNADVLLHIFSFCRDDDPLSVWAASQTCSEWRTLTLEHPILWSHIVVDNSSTRLFGLSSLSQWLNVWLTRSGTNRELDIVLKLRIVNMAWSRKPSREDVGNILRAVSTQAHRWRSFTYRLEASAIRPPNTEGVLYYAPIADISRRLGSLPLLQFIRLSQGCYHPTREGITPQCMYDLLSLQVAPRLQSVSLRGIYTNNSVPDWNVKHVSYRFSTSTFLTFSAFPLITSLQLFSWTQNSRGWPNLGMQPVLLPCLTELRAEANVSVAASLELVDMPVLSKLTLDARETTTSSIDGNGFYSTNLLRSLATRPRSAPLTSVVLYLSTHNIPWNELACFTSMESLRIIKRADDLFWSSLSRNISFLLRPIASSNGRLSWHLPQLQILTLKSRRGSARLLSNAWPHYEERMQCALQARWKAARHSKQMATLSLYLVGPSRTMKICDDSTSDDTSAGVKRCDMTSNA
ncbi:hypothetical protein CALCODRAFT_104609 [Calocera cornea HHB12733]|uniref:F-box domain-containing protein n=1 Tax=Calocera cornea HHB12733 TaxID=1353952 RepID=A0A165D467_9BASI|nr:hypothetical protein CALCODRAFT_104609 [Calocera cornea HHB12733]